MFADTTTIIHHCKHFLLTNGESGKHAAFSVLRRNLLPARYSGRGSTRFDAKDQSIGAPSVRKKRGFCRAFLLAALLDSILSDKEDEATCMENTEVPEQSEF